MRCGILSFVPNEEKYLEPCNFVIRHETGQWQPGSQTVALYATRETMQRMVEGMTVALEKWDSLTAKNEQSTGTLFFDYAVDGGSNPYVSSISLGICEDLRPFHRLPTIWERGKWRAVGGLIVSIVLALAIIGGFSIFFFLDNLHRWLAS